MWQYIVRRLLLMVPTLLGAAILVPESMKFGSVLWKHAAAQVVQAFNGGSREPGEQEALAHDWTLMAKSQR
jgi:ABC-type microcin C transport system permease subunit YejB